MSKFQIGDRVLVVKKVEDYSDGWENTWATDMNRYVGDGKIYTIDRVSIYGVYFKEDSGRFGWPPQALELCKEIPYGGIIRKIKQMEERRKELGYKF